MSTTAWTPTQTPKDGETPPLPPEGVDLTVTTPSGDERTLRFERNLWWLPDMSMYCYFTPVFWRRKDPAS